MRHETDDRPRPGTETPPARTPARGGGRWGTAAGWLAVAVLVGYAATRVAFDVLGIIMEAVAQVTGEPAFLEWMRVDWGGALLRLAALAAGIGLAVTLVRRGRRARGACTRCGAGPAPRWRLPDRLTVLAGYAVVPLAAGYGALKAHWGLGGTVGLTDPRAFAGATFWTPGLGDTAVLAAVAMLLGLGFARTWRPPLRMPYWTPVAAAAVGCVMLLPVGVMGSAQSAAVLLGLAEPTPRGELAGVAPWVFLVVYPWFLALGLALAAAAIGYRRRTRGRCRACGRSALGESAG